ncbi:hypothetical protein ACFYO5_27360 [Streptomyces sp. NPDC006259]|uniref:hypothetical protein n=1 Tax=Streptomyces sp. NPDC006259 TaxID=3364740 RepID=UPI0036884175
MSSPARNVPRHRSWLRVLVLLLAVLVPGAPAAVHAPAPVAAAEIAEYDALDALRPAGAAARRAVAPRPAPAPAPAVTSGRVLRAPSRPPYPPAALNSLRAVVLRC